MAHRLLAASDVDGQRGFAVLLFLWFAPCRVVVLSWNVASKLQGLTRGSQYCVHMRFFLWVCGVLCLCVHECLCCATLLNFLTLLHPMIFKGSVPKEGQG